MENSRESHRVHRSLNRERQRQGKSQDGDSQEIHGGESRCPPPPTPHHPWLPARHPSPVGCPNEREASSQCGPDLGRYTKVSWRQKERHTDLGSLSPLAPSQSPSPPPPATLTQSDLPRVVDGDVGSLGKRGGIRGCQRHPSLLPAQLCLCSLVIHRLSPPNTTAISQRPPPTKANFLPPDHFDVPVYLLL